MTKNTKYAAHIGQDGSSWNAQITRQVTSRKTIVSKKQGGFPSEAGARTWAEQQLAEYTNTQSKRNERHGQQRKMLEELRRQRSNRRAEKTVLKKVADSNEQNTAAQDSDAIID